MLLANDETDGRTLEEIDLTGLTLQPTSAGRAAIRTEHAERLRELRRKSDELQIEVALGCPLDEFRADHPSETRGIPTDAELRAKCAELGYPVPQRRTTNLDAVRAEWKRHMYACLRSADRQAGR